MYRLKLGIISFVLPILLSSCSQQIDTVIKTASSIATAETSIIGNPFPNSIGINPNSLPRIVTEKDIDFDFGSIESIYGFSGKDISDKDFSRLSLDKISEIAFNTDTKWSTDNKLPKGFSSELWLEAGKDPGLQIRQLHMEGHTGKGISVAIIDKPILFTNKEFNKDNFIYTPIATDTKPHFHGISCASILAGKNCGVAPESKLYYFAVPDNGKNFDNYDTAIDKIIEINNIERKKKSELFLYPTVYLLTMGKETTGMKHFKRLPMKVS